MRYYITFLALIAVANEIGLGRMNWIIGILVLGVIFYYVVEEIYEMERKKK